MGWSTHCHIHERLRRINDIGYGLDEQRFAMVRNLEAAAHDAHVRDRLVGLLEDRIDGSDELDPDKRAELRGRIREKPGLWRYLRVTSMGLLRIDWAKIASETRLDGKTLLRTSEMNLDAEQIARGYEACPRSNGGGAI